MSHNIFTFALAFVLAVQVVAKSQNQPEPGKSLVPDGVYRVLREGAQQQELLPLKMEEAMVPDHARYVKHAEGVAPRYLVVRKTPDVPLALVRAAEGVREEGGLRIQLQLTAAAAAALERVTREHPEGQLTIVLKGEVVTTHKIRSVIKDGAVQITSCEPAAGEYLLEQLRMLAAAR